MSDNIFPTYPAEALPEDPRLARLLGVYNQRQEGLLLQRIKILGGRLSLAQWRAVAELARRLTPGYPLRLTTRQDIEFHGLTPENVPLLQHELHRVGIGTVGACGDTLRNVTLCPDCGLLPGTFDLAPLAEAIHALALARPTIFSMPRKFKISLSGSLDGCARPWINDLGLAARPDCDLKPCSFQAILAGSLGARPNPGILCYERLALEEILPLVVAALRLFEAEGDRKNRSRARLRHVRERLGDKLFLERLDELFREEKTQPYEAPPVIEKFDGPAPAFICLHPPQGNLAPESALALIGVLEAHGAEMRIGFEHDLHLFGLAPDDLPEPLREWIRRPRMMACPGAHLCQRGVAETWGVAEAIAGALAPYGEDVRENLMIAISGCPNNCSHAAVADIGLIGRVKTIEGTPQPHYRLLAGGGRGMSPVLARELHPAVPQGRVGGAVGLLAGAWVAASPDHALPFGEFIAREQEHLASRLAAWLDEERAAAGE